MSANLSNLSRLGDFHRTESASIASAQPVVPPEAGLQIFPQNAPGATPTGWRETVTNAAVGVAGTAGAVTFGALAYYAYCKLGTAPALLIDPSLLKELGQQSVVPIHSAMKGLGQIHSFVAEVLSDQGAGATMGDFLKRLYDGGFDPQAFKAAAVQQADMIGGTKNAAWAARLANPETPLTPMVQHKIAEVIWYHDKQVALGQAGAADALEFAKAGAGTVIAAGATLAAVSAQTLKVFMGHMKSAAYRAAVVFDLIDDESDRQIRKTIKAGSFDPIEARARLAAEYAERQAPMHRFYTQHWMEAARAQDRTAMLTIFGMEPHSLGKHSAIGQSILIDNFFAKELRDLARAEPEYAKTLNEVAARRERLERARLRQSAPTSMLGEQVNSMPVQSIAEMVEANFELHRRSRSPSPA